MMIILTVLLRKWWLGDNIGDDDDDDDDDDDGDSLSWDILCNRPMGLNKKALRDSLPYNIQCNEVIHYWRMLIFARLSLTM